MKLRIKEAAEKIGIKNASQLRTRTGLGTETCYQLWEGTARMIGLDTLNTLCNVLQVGPAYLFEYTPDVESKEREPQSGEAAGRRSSSSSAKPKRESKQTQTAIAIG